jgi:spore maturation protein CgeB
MAADHRWDKKVLAVLLEWDYGDQRRGPSMERVFFYDTLSALVRRVEPFWYDAYLNDIPALQQRVIAKAREYAPDLILFVPFADQFSPETLDRLKSQWRTAAWFGDDTWRFESFTARMAPHFTYAATTDLFSVPKYRKLGIDPIVTQWAAQLSGTAPGPVPPGSYEYDVSFVGGCNVFRAWYIDMLKTMGISVRCFGAGWPAGRVSFGEMDRIFYTSRINLNLSNSTNHDIRFILSSVRSLANYVRSSKRYEQIKARNFEIPLAGGFQLTNYVAGLEKYLSIGEEVAVFSTPEECAQQVRYYLANEDQRVGIAVKGQRRAQAEHTYSRRLGAMLEAIWK